MKIVELLMRQNLPQRNFFQASEISTLLNIKPHEIRYWETEFPQIRSQKSKNGQRIYRRQDVILFSAIKHLLQEKKLTLAGAQKILADSEDYITPQVDNARPPAVTTNDEKISDIFSKKPDRILEEASRFLDENDEEFDELAHEAYQQCAEIFDERAPTKERDAVINAVENRSVNKNQRPSRSECDKTLAVLMASKKSLLELLESLDKFCESEFGQGFKEYSASEQRLKDGLYQRMSRY